MPPNSVDTILVGAGHNGLVAACYLARAGQRVLVLEAAEDIGGCTTSGYLIPDAPRHVVNACAADFILIRATPVVSDLQLGRYGYQELDVDPGYAVIDTDDGSIAFWRDPQRTADEIRHFSRDDARTYLEFTNASIGALRCLLPVMMSSPVRPGWRAALASLKESRRLRGSRILARLPFMTAGEAAADLFRHPLVQGAYGMFSGLVGPAHAAGSGVNLVTMASLPFVGTGRPVGGAGSLPNALRLCLEAHGGEIRTSAPVDRLLVSGGRIRGVAVGEEELHANTVVTACDPHAVLKEMLPPGALSRELESRARQIPSSSLGSGNLKVDLALDGPASLSRHSARRNDDLDLRVPALLIGSLENLVDGYLRADHGELSEPIALTGLVPTAVDPSQAPKGQDELSLWIGWAPGEIRGGWEEQGDTVGQAMVARAREVYDGLDQEIGRLVETPIDIARRTRAPHGNPSHVDGVLMRSGPLRPALGLAGYRTPVAGLFLSGAGTHPGGSVTGLPGRNAALAVLKEDG